MSMDAPARIFVVEDHAYMKEMLSEFLSFEADMEVCDTAGSGEAALRHLDGISPDFMLVDLSLPGVSGLELIASVKARRPELPCAILSGHGERRYAEQAIAVGAQGYVLKGDPDELPDAIRRMLRGEQYISQALQY
ncbi:response regulator transcription factor [Halomonas sp. McH1-25]|uniref:response regulator n=1 Tax=unclassified Halomonas TaxID=2609666 RepID=UPI001EF513DB|nr:MULTISPECIES: response regulator transcription factor [unclassified Halomonas]MCG7600110.1 response regulator transcription factor [Halomonas sp. McH1-25]MCP1341359.1 response regulator transcription factor [Halomonas sp. FL8]MCP1359696.1 response regulator transcription factor [Halomonas sp. BBD45]MCP1364877.1 response regulator transcription factor [Halomonas sp. BBD48]